MIFIKIQKNRKLFIFICICLFIFLSIDNKVIAAPIIEFQENGTITFKVQVKTASTSIRYTSVGFNITRNKIGKTESPLGKCVSIDFERDKAYVQKKEVVNGENTAVTYTISGDFIRRIFAKSTLKDIEDGDTIYFHAIMQVRHGNTLLSTKYHQMYNSSTGKGIINAESWSFPADLEEYFNIGAKFKSPLNPVEVEYKSAKGVPLGTEKFQSEKAGAKVSVILKPTITKDGITYELYRSYYINEGYTTKQDDLNMSQDNSLTTAKVQNRSAKVKIGGIKFVGMMRVVKPDKPEDEPEDVLVSDPWDDKPIAEGSRNNEYEEPYPEGIIAADTRGNEKFDVTEGIPSSENLYVNAFTMDYVVGYKLKKIVLSKDYPITITKNYILTWTTYDEWNSETMQWVPNHHTVTVPIKQDVSIKRYYAYWIIENLEVYVLDSAKIENQAIQGGVVNLSANIIAPTVEYTHSTNEKAHVTEPKHEKNITLPPETIYGGNYRPSIPSDDFKNYITYDILGKPMVKNDKLIIDGQVILSDEQKEKFPVKPKAYKDKSREIGADVLYKFGLTIPAIKANDEYATKGSVTYKKVETINSTMGNTVTYTIQDLDSVIVHTPVVCDAAMETKKAYNQKVTPNKAFASLVLDTSFSIQFSTIGSHINALGYQYNDYSKYTSDRQVKFPFDIYKGSTYIQKNTWISSTGNESFYLPIWVDEGIYTVNFRSISINASANNKLNYTESLMNGQLYNYVATDSVTVEVSGRVFGFNIYDISDYPMWENVFRQEKSLKLTGFNYPVGTKNHNGVTISGANKKITLTPVNGSHPYYTTQGVIKTGYAIRFSLTTMGNMTGNNDYINIKPRFYFIDKNGNNRQEVDIYYTETFGGRKQILVKVGSDKDKTNIKKLSLADVYLGVPKDDINNTSVITGKNLKNVQWDIYKAFTYSNITLPSGLRTFAGTKTNLQLLKSIYNNLPASTIVSQEKRISSMQKWYGEYYLPGEIHVVPKGFDLIGKAKEHALNYKESFWLKEGYIIVNFNIEVYKNGVRYLSYINAENAQEGYCNMWKMEGYQYSKTDNKGTKYNFKDGDTILYYAGKSIQDDYISGGTH